MGKRGPTPKPSAILKLRGSRYSHPDEPQPEKKRPDCPSWMDAKAKRIWQKLCPMLEEMTILTVVDGNALARYCTMFVRWRDAEEFLRNHGTTYPIKGRGDKVTGFVAFPQVRMAQSLSDSLLRLEQNFGLTPSARTRLMVDKKALTGTEGKGRFFGEKTG